MNRPRLSPAVLILVAFLAVLVCTLFPFNFTNDSFRVAKSSLLLEIGPELGPEVLENALLFVPFGLALAIYCNRKGIRSWVAMISVLAASLALSYSVELLQLFLPDRVSSLTDVFSNVGGGCLGFVVFGRWRDTALADAVAYLTAISLMSIPLQWSTTLRNWEREFSLVVGNEHTGDRPWRGRVFDVSVLDRALSDSEVAELLGGGKAAEWIVNSTVASYEPSAPGGYRDKSGHLPPLAWRTTTPEAVETAAYRWLETTGPAAPLVDRVKRGSAFTLLVTAATADTYQTGPARIVSLSRDPGRRNFTLGQSGTDMVFRLRTPLTGENGSPPEFVVPGVFSTRATRRLVITYDGLDLTAYLDGVRAQATRLGLGAPAFAPLFSERPQGSYVYNIAYHALVFLPAGVLVARIGDAARRSQPFTRIALLAACVLVCSLVFELILVVTSGRLFNWSNVFWVVTLAATGIAVRNLERTRKTRRLFV